MQLNGNVIAYVMEKVIVSDSDSYLETEQNEMIHISKVIDYSTKGPLIGAHDKCY